MNELTPREDELLRLIQQWRNQHGANSIVERKWIEQKMHVSTTWLSDLKKSLISKGFLEKDRRNFTPTKLAISHISKVTSINSHSITPTYLPILGQVRAGRVRQDELRIDIAETSLEEGVMIAIPDLEENTFAFILEVVGFSMEHEKIYEGDYVIVQPYRKNQMPKQRELIVTYYLPPRNEQEVEDTVEMDDTWFDGPTLKYYTEVAGKERPYRLSWKRDIQGSEYTIETKRIKPIGKVIGVYRAIKK